MFLSPISLAVNRPGRRQSLEQAVAALFAAGEQGAWYDPSAANVTWRRNQFIRTEDFNNAYWGRVRCIINSAAATPPTGLTSADEMECNSAGYAYITRGPVNGYGLTSSFTISIYAKRVNRDTFTLDTAGSSTADATSFTLTGAGSFVAGANTENSSITAVGNGWYRCSTTRKGSVAASNGIYIGMESASIGDKVLLTGAQIEQSLTPTAYQRIVTPEITYLADVQSQPLLFQDSTGATPVTAVEQPVGLILDKRKGLVLGPELVTNGDFATDTVWDKLTGWAISGGVATHSGGATGLIRQTVSITAGKWYKLTVTVSGRTVSQLNIQLGSGSTQRVIDANGTYDVYLLAGASDSYLSFNAVTTFDGSIDNVTLKLLDGNHAYQTGSTARPVLRARYNLLTYSEQFNDASWVKVGATVTANTILAPDGTTTADKLVENTASGSHDFRQNVTVSAVGYVFSCYVQAAERSKVLFGDLNKNLFATYTLSGSGTVDSQTGGTATIQLVPSTSWYRITLSGTFASGSRPLGVRLLDGSGSDSYTGDGTSGLYVWGADLRVGTSAGDYQRIAAATDYATTSTITGQPFRPYIAFDGSDDFLQAGVTQSAYPLTLAAGIENLAASSVGGIMSLAASDSVYKTLRHTGVNGNDVNDREAANTTTSTVTVAGRKFALGQFETSAMTVEVNTTNTQTAANTNAFGSLTTLFLGKVRPSGLISESKIYGALAINRVLTAGEKSATQSYMASKMGVTL